MSSSSLCRVPTSKLTKTLSDSRALSQAQDPSKHCVLCDYTGHRSMQLACIAATCCLHQPACHSPPSGHCSFIWESTRPFLCGLYGTQATVLSQGLASDPGLANESPASFWSWLVQGWACDPSTTSESHTSEFCLGKTQYLFAGLPMLAGSKPRTLGVTNWGNSAWDTADTEKSELNRQDS